MKGLAIASFILGVIGFLLSFIFGLGILPSILAVIFGTFPLIKKVLRLMSIPGVVMGLLGILISVSLFVQKPEDIIEQTIKEIARENETRPSKIFLKKRKEIANLSPNELYNTLNKFTGVRQDEEWKKYRGKYVKWEGELRPFGGSPRIGKAGVEVNLAQRANRGYILIRVIFNEKEANKLFELKEGDVISFMGRLADMSMSMLTDYHFRLENGEVSKITKKDTKYYGELSIENLVITPHIFGDECAFSITGLGGVEKGMKRIAIIMRLKNNGSYWIFPSVMPGYIIDNNGDIYREEGDAIINNHKNIVRTITQRDTFKKIIYKPTDKLPEDALLEINGPLSTENGGCVAILMSQKGEQVRLFSSSSESKDKIGPDEEYRWVFIFDIPEDRKVEGFQFHYSVRKTASALSEEIGIFSPLLEVKKKIIFNR